MTKISVIICTYNGEKVVPACIDSILKQKFKDWEIICADGGSTDSTLEILKAYGKDKRIKIINNPNRLPEGKYNGKWLAARQCKGKIIGFIDSDNILQSSDFFDKLIKAFDEKKKEKIIGILGELTHDLNDSPIVRYVSLFGTDSFMAYRSVDYMHRIEGCRTSMEVSNDNMPLSGGNCFFYLKEDLDKVGGYDQDVLTVQRLICKGHSNIVIIPNSTKHYAEKNLWKLIIKKFSWGKKYATNQGEKFNYMPSTLNEWCAFSLNFMFTLSILPNFICALAVYKQSKDWVAFLYPPIAFMNLVAYGWGKISTF